MVEPKLQPGRQAGGAAEHDNLLRPRAQPCIWGGDALHMTTARDMPHAGEQQRAHILQRAAPGRWERPALPSSVNLR